MPMYRNPKFAYVEPRGGGGLVVAASVVAAWGYLAWWLAREIAKAAEELAIIAGGTLVGMGAFCAWMIWHFHHTSLPVNHAAEAEILAERRTALPAGQVHYHTHYEEHHHLHQAPAAGQHIHVHQAAAEAVPAIAARKVVPGVVLRPAPEAIEARREPLYQARGRRLPVIREKS